ncbi:hypothetical protein AB0M32_10735 [Streptomyces sp. NPDC051985]|uniref:hypothetical protein n=1 Tax=Streptomyces sp. NPDC051985 TaxID=3155807 RepID=UPI003416BBF8
MAFPLCSIFRYAVIGLLQMPLMHDAAEWSRPSVLAFSATSSALGVIGTKATGAGLRWSRWW